MRALAPAALLLALSGCTLPLNQTLLRTAPSLSQNPAAPELAALHFAISRWKAGRPEPHPTLCAGQGQEPAITALPEDRELHLIAAIPDIAPFARCTFNGAGWSDTITGSAAVMFDVHELECAAPDDCKVWVGTRMGWTHYRLRYREGAWQIANIDPGIVLT